MEDMDANGNRRRGHERVGNGVVSKAGPEKTWSLRASIAGLSSG